MKKTLRIKKTITSLLVASAVVPAALQGTAAVSASAQTGDENLNSLPKGAEAAARQNDDAAQALAKSKLGEARNDVDPAPVPAEPLTPEVVPAPAPEAPAPEIPPPVEPAPTPAPTPVEPAPAPEAPAPVEPAPAPEIPPPVEPAPTPAPTPVEPAPAPEAPAPVEPAPAPEIPPPVEPAPTPAPTPVEPAPAPEAPAPVEPAPTPEIPPPVEPAPTPAPTPVEPAPAPEAPAPEIPPPAEPAVAPEVPVVAPEAPSTEAQVNNLLLEAYDAKDKNDLATARTKAEEALKLAPGNEAAKALITELDTLATPKAQDTAVPVPVPVSADAVAPAPADVAPAAPAQPQVKNQTILEKVVQKHQSLFDEIENAREYADLLSNYGEHDKAIAVIDGALGALPDNSGLKTNMLQQRLIVKRQEIIGRRQGVDKNLDVQVVTTMHEAEAQNNRRAKEAMQKAELALAQIKQGRLDDAQATLEGAFKILPTNIALEEKSRHLRGIQARLYEQRYSNAIYARDLDKAEFFLSEHARVSGKDSKAHTQLLADFEARRIDPNFRSAKSINPRFVATEEEVKEKLIRAKKLYFYGDYEGAKHIFEDILLYQPNNAQAKAHLLRIAKSLEPVREMNQLRTHKDFMAQVSDEWTRPDIYERPAGESTTSSQLDPIIQIMRDTRVPTINLRDLQLTKVIETLMELSVVYSPNQKPINMTIRGITDRDPTVTIVMTDVSLDKLLDFITKQVNFNYIVEDGVVVVRPDAGSSDIDTESFTLNQAGMRRMGKTAHQAALQASSSATGGFGSGGGSVSIAPTGDEDSEIIKRYLQRHNVMFDGIPGVGLSYDGTEVTITHNRQNLERCRKLLEKLSDVTLINVQSKFIDISEGAMRELATNFTLSRETAAGVTETKVKTGNRTLDSTFGISSRGRDGQIIKTSSSWTTTDGILQQTPGETSTFTIPGTPPMSPGNISATNSPVLDTNIATIGGWDLRLLINALESHESSDVLAAPNVTVTSGDSEGASIELYQRLIYPSMYNEPTVQVSSNGSNNYGGGGGEASAAIKAATPSELLDQKVGITFKVNANYIKEQGIIELRLAPEIVEFEGFIEYGGVSVAVAGGTTVTAPSGFFQPVFSHRKVTTNVAVFDGATVVIGGLTREEVKTVEDKVPVLGDIPIIGGAFRSKGKTTNKRNLMIFVTANRMTPGGAPKNSIESVPSTAIFANPTLITPSGPIRRQINTGAQPKTN